MSSSLWLAVLVFALGCGRIGFAPMPELRVEGSIVAADGGQPNEADGSVALADRPSPTDDCLSTSMQLTSAERVLADLPAGSFWQATSSKMRDVCPTDRVGCEHVVGAWSGGAFDSVGNRMLVLGGGSDHAGNEVYAFELATLTWHRLTEPSPVATGPDPLPDGSPTSRHTYDGLAFIAHANRLLMYGGSELTWTLDPSTRVWRDMRPGGGLTTPVCCTFASAYDEASGAAIFHLVHVLAAYHYDENRWEELTELDAPPLWPRYQEWGSKRAVLDSRRGLVWFLGSDLVMVWDIARRQAVTDEWITTGGAPFSNAEVVVGRPEQLIETTGGEVITADAPAADYDPVADDIVAWVGGAPWVLELETRVWSQRATGSAPVAPQPYGTFGRFRYVPRTNVFVLVNDVDEDVWFYKHTEGCGG